MKISFTFVYRLGSELDRQTFKGLNIHAGEQYTSVYLTAGQFWQLIQSSLCIWIIFSTGREGNQNFIGVKTRIAASKIFCLQFLDRTDSSRRDHVLFMVDTGQYFQCIQ